MKFKFQNPRTRLRRSVLGEAWLFATATILSDLSFSGRVDLGSWGSLICWWRRTPSVHFGAELSQARFPSGVGGGRFSALRAVIESWVAVPVVVSRSCSCSPSRCLSFCFFEACQVRWQDPSQVSVQGVRGLRIILPSLQLLLKVVGRMWFLVAAQW